MKHGKRECGERREKQKLNMKATGFMEKERERGNGRGRSDTKSEEKEAGN